jgi:hypothetical protein
MLSAGEFLERWLGSAGSERSHSQPFFMELCDLLDVPRPPTQGDAIDGYRLEKPLEITHPDGHRSQDRIDFYKKGCFVIEAKQARSPDAGSQGVRRGTPAWQAMMERAFAQARNYAVNLPEGRPPFLMTCDIGHCFEVWTGFNGDYGRYGARRNVPLEHLARDEVRQEFATIFTDPWSLDPSRRAARVTSEVASHLADLARSLEADGTNPEVVARFLMRCLFTMFAEDVGLLESQLFTQYLTDVWIPHPERFPAGIEALWREMDRGGLYGPHPIRRFNGGLFREVHAMELTRPQLERLLSAARCDWSDVEPAIFGTMLERALNKNERQQLGAHFTPREYIERLVRPTVIEPLRAEWDAIRGAARQLVEPPEADTDSTSPVAADAPEPSPGVDPSSPGDPDARPRKGPSPADRRQAARLVRDFLQRLCAVKVLDPACGTGNFLYVTFDLVKDLEAEVLRELLDLGDTQGAMEMAGVRVVPEQFLGLEINPRAQAIADLVLWLGYLQWARRAKVSFSDPVLRDGRNIVCRDAILAHDQPVLRRDQNGKPVTVWDMRTFRKHPVTGRDVPDETAQAAVHDYPNARIADWPDADFIVSNPPFVGNKRMREALGDGYTEALRKAWPGIDGSVDLVMYWWEKAARLAREGRIRRFGFITTNSITQAFNRKVLEPHLQAEKDPVVIAWAIPDHPWVINGAAVRIAMTVGCRADQSLGKPVIGRVTREDDPVSEPLGAARLVDASFQHVARIHADLSGGADVAGAVPLRANQGLSYQGMNLVGKGFRITRQEVRDLGYDPDRLPPVIRPYMNARELTQNPEDRFVIDMYGLGVEEVRDRYPTLFQWLLERVKPERDHNKDPGPKARWWLFGRARPDLREALVGLRRYIITPETAKHRFFVFAPMELCPDHQLYAICIDDAWVHGVLSSRFQTLWSLAAGGWMGLGNDPRWRNQMCFDPFPFPDATETQKERISHFAIRLDVHRKRVQADQPDVTLTGMYNAMERLRDAGASGAPLTPKERDFHDRALIGVLRSIHDDLDAAVADAYGWPPDLPDDEILTRLVSLNAVRAAQEAQGQVLWLRPDFQRARAGIAAPVQQAIAGMDTPKPAEAAIQAQPWPRDRYEQIKAVRDLVAARPGTYTATEIATAFKTAPTPTIRRHLDMLERIGVLVAYQSGPHRRYHASTT